MEKLNRHNEWFNSFMGLVLGVLAGIFVLGVFSKNATNIGAYVGFIVSAILVINLKYNQSRSYILGIFYNNYSYIFLCWKYS